MKTRRQIARRNPEHSPAEAEPAHSHPSNALRAGAIALITSLLLTAPAALLAKTAKKKVPRPHVPRNTLLIRRRDATELPDDQELPGLAAICAACLGESELVAGPGAGPVEFLLRGYTPGSRATIEARAAGRRVAIKVYARDPAPEARLYQALAAAGLCGDFGVRVPPLLVWERDLRLLVIGWLEGPTAGQLVHGGQGQRAGQLAAAWIQRAASLRLNLGPTFGAERMLHRARQWAAQMSAAWPAVGTAAQALVARLEGSQPREEPRRLVHGTFYARHILDLGDGPGVIDWMRFGQGPLELDAGMFLASIWRLGLRQPALAGEAARAKVAFLAGTVGLLDPRALAWHRAAALLRLADKQLDHRHGDWRAWTRSLLREATRLAPRIGGCV